MNRYQKNKKIHSEFEGYLAKEKTRKNVWIVSQFTQNKYYPVFFIKEVPVDLAKEDIIKWIEDAGYGYLLEETYQVDMLETVPSLAKEIFYKEEQEESQDYRFVEFTEYYPLLETRREYYTKTILKKTQQIEKQIQSLIDFVQEIKEEFDCEEDTGDTLEKIQGKILILKKLLAKEKESVK